MGFRRAPVASDRRFRLSRNSADHGTAERWQHSGRMLEITERAGVLAARALEENVLDVLVVRRWISATQREAALRFKLDYHAAGLEARLTSSYNPMRVAFSPFGPWDERSDAEEAAYQRWRKAVRAMGTPVSDMVITVVCHDRIPLQRRAVILQAGLEKLVKWYGMAEGAR